MNLWRDSSLSRVYVVCEVLLGDCLVFVFYKRRAEDLGRRDATQTLPMFIRTMTSEGSYSQQSTALDGFCSLQGIQGIGFFIF